ncbi:MAG: tyrosine--tRNA ligase [Myxococcota bacterium]
MAEWSSSVLAELEWRGFIKDQTHPQELDEALASGQVTLYCGFDPTSNSLHVGSLVPMFALSHFLRHGHAPVALVGGATGMIGDPSGKSDERNLLDEATLHANLAGIRAQLERVLANTRSIERAPRQEDADVVVVNNHEWVGPRSFLHVLRDVGKFFKVNQMIQKDSVRSRLESESGISYTEFSYMLIQAMDFQELFDRRGCRLQIGGSDQWGNITAGTDLVRRTRQESVFGLTMPLLMDAKGDKFGKSTEGMNVWLDAERTSPFAFYQFWINVDDADVPTLLRRFTFFPKDKVEELSAKEGRELNDAKRELAYHVTSLVHSPEEADRAVRASKMLFGEEISGLTDKELLSIFSDVPSLTISRARLDAGVSVLDLLTELALESSRGKARRLLAQGGVTLNNSKKLEAIEGDYTVTPEDLTTETSLVLRAGKKRYAVIRAE